MNNDTQGIQQEGWLLQESEEVGIKQKECGESPRRKGGHSTKAKDLTGMMFGRLTVIKLIPNRSPREWECLCSCGSIGTKRGSDLTSGKSKSCGCLSRELTSKLFQRHGMTNTPTYRSWSAMITRCTNHNRNGASNYIGRGISVCERWLNSFEYFLKDMGERPDGKTLDRFPNQNGNYEPGNCRWATIKEQGNNTRRCRIISYNGKTQNITQWATELGVSQFTLFDRLRRGLEPSEILKTNYTKRVDVRTN